MDNQVLAPSVCHATASRVESREDEQRQSEPVIDLREDSTNTIVFCFLSSIFDAMFEEADEAEEAEEAEEENEGDDEEADDSDGHLYQGRGVFDDDDDDDHYFAGMLPADSQELDMEQQRHERDESRREDLHLLAPRHTSHTLGAPERRRTREAAEEHDDMPDFRARLYDEFPFYECVEPATAPHVWDDEFLS